VLAHDKATGNGDAGLYVGGEQDVRARVVGNTSWDNAIGSFPRDVSNGSATGNHVFGNCTGVLLLANAPGPVTNWKVRRNIVRANNRTDCGEEDPAPSGSGILLWGASDNDISRNLVLGNRGEGRSLAGSSWSPPSRRSRAARRPPRRQRRPQERRPPQPAVRHLLGRRRRRQPVPGQPLPDLPAGWAVRLTRP
jgi:parallel beta-helix repeat protein